MDHRSTCPWGGLSSRKFRKAGWGAVLEQLESVLPLVVPVIADLFAWREWVQVMEELERVVPLMLLRFKERRRLRVLQHYESEGIWEILSA